MGISEYDDLNHELARLTKRLERASHNIADLEDRLERVENSAVARLIGRVRAFGRTRKRQLGQWLLHSPFHPFYLKMRPPAGGKAYISWAEEYETTFPSIEWQAQQVAMWAVTPVISVIMPTYNPRREWLEAAIDSVTAQSYPRWELCICDDSSTDPWVLGYLQSRASSDPRIRFVRSEQRLGIAGALNRAGALATGEYLAFLDHDDMLHRFALHFVAAAVQEGRPAVVYSDEDFLDEAGTRTNPQFKPDWSPDLLLSCMYFGHLFVAARDRVERAGWFRSCCDGSQDYDLALRITNDPAEVRHIPRILYHWRRHPQSTASTADAKPYTHAAGRRALEHAVHARGIAATIEDGLIANTYYVQRSINGEPLASIIIGSGNPRLLARCLKSLEGTSYPKREIIVIHHGPPNGDFDAVLQRFGVQEVQYTAALNFARMNNLGADAARGGIYLFLNENIRVLRPDWLHYFIAHLQRPEIGAAGGKLLYPSGAIQHAGIVTGMMDGAGHAGRESFRSDRWGWLDLVRNVSAVTGASLGIRKEVFHDLGGFDSLFPVNYGDVDLCLRAQQAGYRIVYDPRAVLQYEECGIRRVNSRYCEREVFYERWSAVLERPDPYYSPALDLTTEEIRLAAPPR